MSQRKSTEESFFDDCGKSNLKLSQTGSHEVARTSFLTIMSNERPPSDNARNRKIPGSFKGKSPSLFQLSRAPPSSIDLDPSSDNSTK